VLPIGNNPSGKIRIVGDGAEVSLLSSVLAKKGISSTTAPDMESALDAQEEDPADLFCVGSDSYSQANVQRAAKAPGQPELVLCVEKKLPNFAKIFMPTVIYIGHGEDSFALQLESALEERRKRRRLLALRDHFAKNKISEMNPAVQLLLQVMKRCTTAESYSDLLSAALSLRTAFEFHDAALVLLNDEGFAFEGWQASKDVRDKISSLSLQFVNQATPELPDGDAMVFSSSKDSWISQFATHPWSSAIGVRLSPGRPVRKEGAPRSALLILFRRDLIPFSPIDQDVLQMTYAPLALALEKVTVIRTISHASKEWRATFDGISEPLTVIGGDYAIVKANKAFAELVGADIKKLKGKKCFSLLANRRSPCIGCSVGTEGGNKSSRIQIRGAAERDLAVWSYAVRLGGSPLHFQFYRNMRIENDLTANLVQAEKMSALGRVVSAIAHEINNPLAAILASSQLLMEESTNLSPENIEDVAEIRQAALRSRQIIQDLLGFTSPERDGATDCQLSEAVRTSLLFAKTALRDVRVETSSLETADERRVRGSLGLVQQIIFNLVNNAAQAMGGLGNLRLKIEENETGSVLFISDDGPGIPRELQSKIFDPFLTTKKEGAGTGLGLAIVKSIADRIGAKVSLCPNTKVGTEFSIQFQRSN
jgi:signal transduction histidine kinase/PAS domain-containing protein